MYLPMFVGLVVPAVLLEPTPRAVLGPGANRLFSPSLLTWKNTWVVLLCHSSLPSTLFPPFLHCSTETLHMEQQQLLWRRSWNKPRRGLLYEEEWCPPSTGSPPRDLTHYWKNHRIEMPMAVPSHYFSKKLQCCTSLVYFKTALHSYHICSGPEDNGFV